MSDKNRNQIEEADDAYYNGDEPIMSDAEYDIEREIFDKASGGKNLKVGASPKMNIETLPCPMFSLDKLKSDEELGQWIEKAGLQPNDEVILMLKFDGISIVRDENDKKAWTRGNGVIGSNVSHKIEKVVRVYHNEYPSLGAKGVYTFGEAIAHTDIPEKKNRRNGTGGLVRPDSPVSDNLKLVDYVRYGTSNLKAFKTKENELNWLNTLSDTLCSYMVIPVDKLCEFTIKEAAKALRESYANPYETDGIVIHVNDVSKCTKLGRNHTGNPAYAVAFKKDIEEIGETTVTKITKQVAKNGDVIPVIHVNPILLDGATVSKFTGYNYDWSFERKCGIGSTVTVKRNGKVSPRLYETKVPTVLGLRAIDWEICPECESKLEKRGVHYYCPNDDCSGRSKSRMNHFITVMGIRGIADGTVSKLYGGGYSDIPSILEKPSRDMTLIDGIGMATAIEITTNLSASLDGVTLGKVSYASGFFNGLGEDKITEIIGNPDSPNITNGEIELFSSGVEDCAMWLERMEPFLTITELEVIDDSLAGMAIVVTGFRSEELKQAIIARGGSVSDSVSSKTSLLIAKDLNSTSSKIANAKRWGVPVVDLEGALAQLKISMK